MAEHPFLSVIIPAHNEEAVIARCLRAITADAPSPSSLEIIVAANGCSDRTVEAARAAAPWAKVLDLPVGSKTGAINAANRAAQHFPRIYLDADVECSYHTLAALATALGEPGVMSAAPAIRLDLTRCNRLMKAYYRAWLRRPYALSGKGGAGCYGLSRAGLEAAGEFPPIIGDDLWIHTRFPDEQRRYVAEDRKGRAVFTTVYPPITVREQIRVEARRRIGTKEVQQLYPSPFIASRGQQGRGSPHAGGTSLADLAVYIGIKTCARFLAAWRTMRGRAKIWSRDLGSRVREELHG